MFPNLANAQISKELKQKINKNDVFSIQLNLRTQVEVDAKIALEKLQLMVSTFISKCVGSNLSKGCCRNFITINNVKKVHQNF